MAQDIDFYIPRLAYKDYLAKKLNCSELFLLYVLYKVAKDTGVCTASNYYLGQVLGLDPRQVSRLVNDLKRKHYIKVTVTRKRGTTTIVTSLRLITFKKNVLNWYKNMFNPKKQPKLKTNSLYNGMNYIKIPAAAYKKTIGPRPLLKKIEILLLSEILTLSKNKHLSTDEYNANLAKFLGVSRPYIPHLLADLRKKGLLTMRYDNEGRKIYPTLVSLDLFGLYYLYKPAAHSLDS